MPPRGQKAATRSVAAGQTAISFAGKSKVTKPSATSTRGKKAKDDSDSVITDITTDEFQTPEAEEPKTSKVVIREQVKQEIPKPKEDVEVEAEGISAKQLKTYWSEREKERKAPRGRFRKAIIRPGTVTDLWAVHQEDLSTNEKILRHFDLSSQYGVSYFLYNSFASTAI